MIVAINMDKLTFLYRHRTVSAVSQLTWLQNHDVAIRIINAREMDHWQWFTLLELNMLYRNATGHVVGAYGRDKIMRILADVVATMPSADINVLELQQQSDFVKFGDDESYRYVKGQIRPQIVDDLYTDSIKVARTAEVNAATAGLPWLFGPAAQRPAAVPPAGANPWARPAGQPAAAQPVGAVIVPSSVVKTVWGKKITTNFNQLAKSADYR